MQPVSFFRRSALRNPAAVAVEDAARQLTYAELSAAAEALAAELQALDPEPGSRVGICAYNSLEHLVAWLATLLAGKVWVPLYPRNGAGEIARCVDFTGVSILCLDEAGEAAAVEAPARHRIPLTPLGRPGALAELLARRAGQRPAPVALPLGGTQAIKFTGGSTGVPKGVMQTLRAWNTGIVSQIEALRLGPASRTLAAAPITHGTSTYLLPTLARGGTLVISDRAKPPEILRLLAERRITTVFLAPTTIYGLLEDGGAAPGACPALDRLVYGAGPMRPEAIARAIEAFGPVLGASYGQTEAPQIITFIGPEELAQPALQASVGRASLLTEVAVCDPESGVPLPPGEVGEVRVGGDLVMAGYWRQPAKTAETLVDGWLCTGDTGLLDERGYLFLKGRLRDVVISGGFNVYPADVEPVLGRHPAVADCAVYGVPDAKWGEAVHAAVQLRPGAEADAAALIAHVRAELGPVRAPKRVVFHAELPRNAYGKILKDRLVALDAEMETQA